jgi:SpoVK/Ycf46/Vps4 family AAA+-type ATPase
MSKTQNTNNKITINTIKVLEKEINIESESPKYTQYCNQKKQLMDEKKSTKEIIELLGSEPNQTMVNINIEKSIQVNPINTKYCSFDNLYLRKQQDIMLYTLLQRFKEDKEIMSELGIPNKLGILLYGEPGCGKTTAIITIASYFGRDIFYVNLKSINTNSDLKMVFDHINNAHSGGGIIVLEDIDAMTKIVEIRSSVVINKNNSELMDECHDSITFEYLLNLLDGTLTYDDSIVIITTNHLENLDPALYRPGRIDNLIELKKCDHYQISRIFNRFIRRKINEDVLKSIPEDTHTPAKVIFELVNWIKKTECSDEEIMSSFL